MGDLKEQARYIFFIPLALSILGASFIMLSHRLFKRDKTEHWIIFFLAFSDFMACVWWLVTYFLDMKDDLQCQLQATGLEFFFAASWMWPLIFAVRLYLILTREKDFDNFIVFHLVAWGFPLILCIVCNITKVFGPTGLWCWITNDVDQFAYGIGLVGGTFVVEIAVFVRITFVLFQTSPPSFGPMLDMKRKAIKKFCMFLLIPLVCWGWGIADRAAQQVNGGVPVVWLQALHGVFMASSGIANALVYGWDRDLRSEWGKFLVVCLSHKKIKERAPLVVNTRTDEMAIPVDFKQTYYDDAD